MKIRVHRGGYAEAKLTEETIEPNKEAIAAYLRKHGWHEVESSMVFVVPYDSRPSRGWDVHHMVKVGIYPAGFCDQMVL